MLITDFIKKQAQKVFQTPLVSNIVETAKKAQTEKLAVQQEAPKPITSTLDFFKKQASKMLSEKTKAQEPGKSKFMPNLSELISKSIIGSQLRKRQKGIIHPEKMELMVNALGKLSPMIAKAHKDEADVRELMGVMGFSSLTEEELETQKTLEIYQFEEDEYIKNKISLAATGAEFNYYKQGKFDAMVPSVKKEMDELKEEFRLMKEAGPEEVTVADIALDRLSAVWQMGEARRAFISDKYNVPGMYLTTKMMKDVDPLLYEEGLQEFEENLKTAQNLVKNMEKFDSAAELIMGEEYIKQTEIAAAKVEFIPKFFDALSLGLSTRAKEEVSKAFDATYSKDGQIYYQDIPLAIAPQFVTKEAQAINEDRFTNVMIALSGGFLTYGVQAVAIGKFLSRISPFMKSLQQSNPFLYGALIENPIQEVIEAGVRKGSGQDYTMSDAIMGLGTGAVFELGFAGLRRFKEIMAEFKNTKVPEQAFAESLSEGLKLADEKIKEASVKKGKPLSEQEASEIVKSVPIGKTTLGELFREQRFAYLKGMDDPNVRAGMDKPAEPADPSIQKSITKAKVGGKSFDEWVNGQQPEFKTNNSGLPPDVKIKLDNPKLVVATRKGIESQEGNELLDDTKRAISKGEQMPPIRVEIDRNGNYLVKDGNHRVVAMKELGFEEVSAYYTRKTLEDNFTKTKSQLKAEWDRPGIEKPADLSYLDPKKTSLVAESIMIKATEKDLGSLFKGQDIAGFTPIGIKKQSKMAADFMKNDMDMALKVIKGDEGASMPSGLKPEALLVHMENYAMRVKDPQLLLDLAQSPINTQISEAAQALRLMAERTKDSATVKILEIAKARKAKAELKMKGETETVVKNKMKQAAKVRIAKVKKYDWTNLVNEITCK